MADFGCHLREILVLAEDHRNVVRTGVGEANDVQSEPDVHAFFFPRQERVRGPVRESNLDIPVTQTPGEDDDALTSHDSQFPFPEMVPERIISRVGDTGVEARFDERPPLRSTHGLGERASIVIGIGTTEGFLGCVKEILPVDERYGALNEWLRGHVQTSKKLITPPEAFRRVERGASPQV